MIQEYSAGAIIFKKERGRRYYLLLHYRSGHWSFVKGHIEKGEEIKDTVRRETAEETGIADLVFISGFEEHTDFYYRRDKQTYHKDVVFFLAEIKTDKIALGSPHEHQGYDWLTYQEALNRLTFNNDRKIFTKAEEFLTRK